MNSSSHTSPKKGHAHPLSQVVSTCINIFNELGFEYAEGPEIESERYNFDALNIPAHHPARDMWDTFWLKPENSRQLLRTHTSPVQVRYMENHKPPVRIIAPGKVFRKEATDATHEMQFYQLEGLAVGPDVTLANLKWLLEQFFEKFFGTESAVRFRPSYFPFVEPGVEIDVSCFACGGTGIKKGVDASSSPESTHAGAPCSVCKGTGWIEIMGAGMVHPRVLREVGIDPEQHRGFAFGVGIDRLVMLKYGIDDVRMLYSGDVRLVNQF